MDWMEWLINQPNQTRKKLQKDTDECHFDSGKTGLQWDKEKYQYGPYRIAFRL
jgi:hypothetical protein